MMVEMTNHINIFVKASTTSPVDPMFPVSIALYSKVKTKTWPSYHGNQSLYTMIV